MLNGKIIGVVVEIPSGNILRELFSLPNRHEFPFLDRIDALDFPCVSLDVDRKRLNISSFADSDFVFSFIVYGDSAADAISNTPKLIEALCGKIKS